MQHAGLFETNLANGQRSQATAPRTLADARSYRPRSQLALFLCGDLMFGTERENDFLARRRGDFDVPTTIAPEVRDMVHRDT